MPSESKAQHNLMAGVAHGWKPDKAKAPPKKVAKEYSEADARSTAAALRGKQKLPPGMEGMEGEEGGI
jgi:hypothetical protein